MVDFNAAPGDGEVPGMTVTAEMLIASMNQSGHWYIEATRDLNRDRPRRQQFPIVPQDELPARGKEWLEGDEQYVQAAKEALYYAAGKPLVLLALPYDPDHPINHQEAIHTWTHARGGDDSLYPLPDRVAWLQQWSALQIEGRASKGAVKPIRFAIVETGYDGSRSGTGDEQLEGLQKIQARQPAVRSASIFEGGMLAHRYSDVIAPHWQDTYVRPVEVESRDDCVPCAVIDDVGGVGSVVVANVHAYTDDVSRRVVA